MVTRTTSGVSISVSVRYLEGQSDPANNHFVFAYRIRITNRNDYTIQLINRHWDIFDSAGQRTVVDGEGVVGEKPVIAPGTTYEYESGCHLHSTIGSMSGWYGMLRKDSGQMVRVEIPEFALETPFVLN